MACRSLTENKETEQWFTAQYCAPEQLLGKYLTTKCDIYSLGVILFELLSERTPFKVGNVSSAEFQKQVIEIPPPLMKLGSSKKTWRLWSKERLSELDSVTQKALRKEPGERYQSVREFAEDLDAWLNHGPVRAKGNHLSYRIRKFLQRNQIATAAVLMVLIATITAIIQVARHGAIAVQERNRAELALSIMTEAFTAADPMQANKGETNVRTVLKSSADRLLALDASHSQDLVKIGLRIAGVQSRLGLTKDSKVLANLAYGKAVAVGDESSRIALNRLRIQAEITLGDFSAAQKLLNQETNEAAREHPEFLLLQSDVYSYDEKGYAPKERLLKLSLRAFEDHLDLPLAVIAHLKLAELNYRTGRTKEAETLASQALEKFRALDGIGSASAIRAEFYQLNLQQRLGSSRNVVEAGTALLPHVERVYGRDSSLFAATHSLLASAYGKLDLPEQAVKHNRLVFDTYRDSIGPMHESTLRAQLNLAFVLKRVPTARTETIDAFQDFVRVALASKLVNEEFRHYGIASAALYFRSIGEHQLALATIGHPDYAPHVQEWSAARRADFANDLFLIAKDAGCVVEPREKLCQHTAAAQCLPVVKRYCSLSPP